MDVIYRVGYIGDDWCVLGTIPMRKLSQGDYEEIGASEFYIDKNKYRNETSPTNRAIKKYDLKLLADFIDKLD
jgi:hypothetical protein